MAHIKVLPAALLYPQQTRYAPMLSFARSFARKGKAKQVCQIVFRIFAFHRLGAHPQVAALLGKKAFGELATLPIEIEINLYRGACRTVTPRPQVLYRRGAVPLKERSANGTHQSAFARLVRPRKNVETH